MEAISKKASPTLIVTQVTPNEATHLDAKEAEERFLKWANFAANEQFQQKSIFGLMKGNHRGNIFMTHWHPSCSWTGVVRAGKTVVKAMGAARYEASSKQQLVEIETKLLLHCKKKFFLSKRNFKNSKMRLKNKIIISLQWL